MLKYAKIINEQTKECQVGLGTNSELYQSIGMCEMDVEKSWNGNWYLAGHLPSEPEKTYTQNRQEEYPSLPDQLDMMYWDLVNGTHVWQETIRTIKEKYPKA